MLMSSSITFSFSSSLFVSVLTTASKGNSCSQKYQCQYERNNFFHFFLLKNKILVQTSKPKLNEFEKKQQYFSTLHLIFVFFMAEN